MGKNNTGMAVLNGSNLKIHDLLALARDPSRRITISSLARKRLDRARQVVDEIVQSEERAYGINTGFGRLSDFSISKDQIEELQENLLVSHAVGVGPSFSPLEVRAILLLRIQSLLLGHSGVREEVVEALIKAFNQRVIPVVPEQGSCGASGDLAPLAHLILPFIGKGEAFVWNKKGNTQVKLKPLRLAAKEGLALINGTQVMTALGAISCARMQTLLTSADIIGAMSLEALMGSKTAFHPRIQEIRPHPGQKKSAANLQRLLTGSAIMASHKNCDKVQDAYSLRCMPQVHGAAYETLAFTQATLEREMNSVTDNPLIFPELSGEERVMSGGNFHGQIVAQSLDFLAISATDLASISERRIERLLNPDLSDLPAFFAYEGGLHSGFMMTQVTAASLVSEAKTLSFPACVDSVPTSANKEDHVSMGTTSARKLRQIISNLEYVLAIELLCAAQGLEYRRPLRSSEGIEAAHRAFRKVVKRLGKDRILKPDIDAAAQFITSGELLRAVERTIGALH